MNVYIDEIDFIVIILYKKNMAFLFLPTIHNSLFNQSKDAVAVINSMQKGSSSSGSSSSSNGNQKPSPILDAFCTSIVKLVILFQMNRYIFYIACAIYWGIDETFGQHLICCWALGVFVSHYMKDLLMIPRLVKPRLSQEYCKKMWKTNNVNFDSCWDIPYEPVVSFTSAVTSVGTICILLSPESVVWIILLMLGSIGFSAYSFFQLNITSITSIVSSLLVGITIPFLWIYYLIGSQFNTTKNTGLNQNYGMVFLMGNDNTIIYNVTFTFVVAFVLLLAYPIPFKYNFSLPYVSKSIFTATGFIIGVLMREYLFYSVGNTTSTNNNNNIGECNPSYSTLYQTTFESVFLSTNTKSNENILRHHQRINHHINNNDNYNEDNINQQKSSDCVYIGSFNAIFALFVMTMIQFFCKTVFVQKFRYSQMYGACFRPRISANATSILENSVHKLNPSIERAREQLYECKRLRRQFEEACIEMKKKQRLLIGGNNKLYNKNKVKSLEKKSLSAYEFIIYEYAIPTNICNGFFDGFIASFICPYFVSMMGRV